MSFCCLYSERGRKYHNKITSSGDVLVHDNVRAPNVTCQCFTVKGPVSIAKQVGLRPNSATDGRNAITVCSHLGSYCAKKLPCFLVDKRLMCIKPDLLLVVATRILTVKSAVLQG